MFHLNGEKDRNVFESDTLKIEYWESDNSMDQLTAIIHFVIEYFWPLLFALFLFVVVISNIVDRKVQKQVGSIRCCLEKREQEISLQKRVG